MNIKHQDRLLGWIYVITVIFVAVMGIISFMHHTTFVIDASFAIIVISLIYYYRKKIIFSWEGALFSCLGFVSNTAGAVGIYELYYQGIGWDKLLHVISTAGISMLAYSYLSVKNKSTRNKVFSVFGLVVITFLLVQGIGAINEITEFIGSRYFGIAQGMFGITNGLHPPKSDFELYDTQWDMIANVIGTIVGIAYMIAKSKIIKNKRIF